MRRDPAAPLGLYVHVPFCSSTCDFCAFYQEEPRRADLDRFLDGIERELELAGPRAPADTIFWGGGTPTALPARDLLRLGRTLLDHLGQPPREWTVELAPASVKPDKLAALRELGVTRLSLGVQSFSPRTLAALGRRHSPAQVQTALAAIRAAGFDNLNLDFIFAIPGQTRADWLADLRAAVALAPAHLSTYCLTYEEDTALWLKLARGQVRPDPQADADFYEATWDFLGESGFAQYEISNFARPGRECRHNLNTWAMHPWIGLGPSAASQWRGRRYANPPDLERWLAGLAAGSPARVDEVALTPALLAADALIFGLRLNRGVDLAALAARFPEIDFAALAPLWEDLAAAGLLEMPSKPFPPSADDSSHPPSSLLLPPSSFTLHPSSFVSPPSSFLRLTRAGRLVADRIGVAILEAGGEDTSRPI
jgi:oxygen-independent coproporphyrinogen III oxidase